jgi:transcriptional regulator with XRE-family HTH domain
MERIKELREERGMTQKELAEALGIDRTAIAKYESGASGAKSEMLEKLATFFGVSTDYLLGRTNRKAPVHELSDGYEDAELREYLQQIKDDPSTRMMFDLARGATLEEIKATVAFLKALREQGQ